MTDLSQPMPDLGQLRLLAPDDPLIRAAVEMSQRFGRDPEYTRGGGGNSSVKAGELSQIHRDYAGSRSYYLAFFSLVQEDDPLWSRMRGLINPMLSYFWVNAWRELGLSMGNPSTGAASPAEIAVQAASNENQELVELWFDMTSKLAQLNPGLVRRVVNQIRLNRGDSPVNAQVAEQLEQMLMQ